MNEIKARINSLGELIEVGYVEGLKFTCTIPSDFIDRFYNYKPVIEKSSIIKLIIIDPFIDWHEKNYTIQIKLTHYTNTQLLAKYPEMAQFAKVLPVHTDFEYVYMYCNRIEELDENKLKEFNVEINKKPC